MKFVRLSREPMLGFTFEGDFATRWFVHLGRCGRLFQPKVNFKSRFATRFALAGDLLLSVATKVGKSAFYRWQRVAVRVDGAGG